ncbi:hypothetical protein Rs2_37619 [Raphanus sativus]|nr:hypothetical protein Rs2_37619 [Raphanus sativus]
MADLLQKAIQSMSLEEEEPLTLPDSPRFRIYEENERSLMGRLLNPDCQTMAKMIDFMPTAWRVFGRVRGIALSRDRFQFVFQREEDLETVLKDRPWSYNYWTMILERWTANPPADYLQTMKIWIRMRNIPANFFTVETMFKLAGEVGLAEKVEYDPKVSHTKDYVRALVLFDANNPAKAARKLSVEGGTVTITYEYEKLHKCCYHCLRLTHENVKCTLRKKSTVVRQKTVDPPRADLREPLIADQRSDPQRFPVLFPELSGEERNMAMLYISHADPTERMARIERVRQGIAEDKAASAANIQRITKELDKGKGPMLSYTALLEAQQGGSSRQALALLPPEGEKSDDDTGSIHSVSSAPLALSGFQLGPSTKGRVIGNNGSNKTSRKRPQAWKRRATGKELKLTSTPSPPGHTEPSVSSKRKSGAPLSSENKNMKLSDPSVASVLKPLQPQ